MAIPTLIAIHGLLESGKDTVTNYLVSSVPGVFSPYAFADPIRRGVKAALDLSDKQLLDRALKELPISDVITFSPRDVIRAFGESTRGLQGDIWLQLAKSQVEKNAATGLVTIFSDLRIAVEVEYVRSVPGSLIIHVINPHQTLDKRHNHATEVGVDVHPEDLVIVNDKTLGLSSLHQHLDNVLRGWGL